MKAKKANNRRFGTWWFCGACPTLGELTKEQMLTHLKKVHNVETKGMKAKRSMLMHMDGDDWHSSQYEWTIRDDLKLIENSCHKRSVEDAMYWH